MKEGTLKADFLLVLTAMIWGFAFVAQRVGMNYVGPFTFNAVRFALGSLSILPLIWLLKKRKAAEIQPEKQNKPVLLWGIVAGGVLFAGASFQQAGMVYTTAGKAGFITGLYVVIVPLLGLFWKQRPKLSTWLGAILAAIGLYFLSITSEFSISIGDLLVLISAFFWSSHVLLIGWLAPQTNSLKLAAAQFAVCSGFSLITALLIETINFASIWQAIIPILYGGLCSVGIAYTLQIIAQRDAHPAHSAIIMSLEGLFAAIGGWLVLGEVLSMRALLGCTLMLVGMFFSQVPGIFGAKKPVS